MGIGSDMIVELGITNETAIGIGIGAGRKTGDPGRNRTCDRLLRRQLLYPLSYGAENAKVLIAMNLQQTYSNCPSSQVVLRDEAQRTCTGIRTCELSGL